MILAATILFLAVLALFIFIDYNKWLKHHDVLHKTEWYVKSACCLPSAVGLALPAFHNWYIALPIAVCMLGFVWWLIFDMAYNGLRGFPILFNGAAEGKVNDSWIDKKLRKLSDLEETALKVVGVALFVFIYIKTIP